MVIDIFMICCFYCYVHNNKIEKKMRCKYRDRIGGVDEEKVQSFDIYKDERSDVLLKIINYTSSRKSFLFK